MRAHFNLFSLAMIYHEKRKFNMNIIKKENIASKLKISHKKFKYLFDIVTAVLTFILAVIGCWIAIIQTGIYKQQAYIAKKSTQPQIIVDIIENSDDRKPNYTINFLCQSGIVYNATLEPYTCIVSTIYDFSMCEKNQNMLFNPFDYVFMGSEYKEQTIVLPFLMYNSFLYDSVGNSKSPNEIIISLEINQDTLDEIENSANFQIPLDDKGNHWVCFPRAGLFLKFNYQDIYGEKHSDYFLLVPEFSYNGLYKLTDVTGEYIYKDCHNLMGEISTYDACMGGNSDIGLSFNNINNNIAEEELKKRYKLYKKYIKGDNIIPVFYTYLWE